MTEENIGSSFESFLDEENLLNEATEIAQKRVLAWQIKEAMNKEGMTKVEFARRMATSRTQLDRLLDPDNTSVTLHTMCRAAAVIGKKIRLELVESVLA